MSQLSHHKMTSLYLMTKYKEYYNNLNNNFLKNNTTHDNFWINYSFV